MHRRGLILGTAIMCLVPGAFGPPALCTSALTHDLKLTISVEEVEWSSGKTIRLPYSIANRHNAVFRGCVMKGAEWKNYFVSGDLEDIVTVVSHTTCEMELTLEPGASASGAVDIRLPVKVPSELQLRLSVLKKPERRYLDGRLVLYALESPRVRYAEASPKKP